MWAGHAPKRVAGGKIHGSDGVDLVAMHVKHEQVGEAVDVRGHATVKVVASDREHAELWHADERSLRDRDDLVVLKEQKLDEVVPVAEGRCKRAGPLDEHGVAVDQEQCANICSV
jgi:hypothetical protein